MNVSGLRDRVFGLQCDDDQDEPDSGNRWKTETYCTFSKPQKRRERRIFLRQGFTIAAMPVEKSSGRLSRDTAQSRITAIYDALLLSSKESQNIRPCAISRGGTTAYGGCDRECCCNEIAVRGRSSEGGG